MKNVVFWDLGLDANNLFQLHSLNTVVKESFQIMQVNLKTVSWLLSLLKVFKSYYLDKVEQEQWHVQLCDSWLSG